jgi:transposase
MRNEPRDERIDEAIRLHLAGHNVAVIAGAFQVADSVVIHWLRSNGHRPRNPGRVEALDRKKGRSQGGQMAHRYRD